MLYFGLYLYLQFFYCCKGKDFADEEGVQFQAAFHLSKGTNRTSSPALVENFRQFPGIKTMLIISAVDIRQDE